MADLDAGGGEGVGGGGGGGGGGAVSNIAFRRLVEREPPSSSMQVLCQRLQLQRQREHKKNHRRDKGACESDFL